jgi:hypothetical protein
MVPERMAAWARIMLADDLPSPVLITSHPMTLDDLAERAALDSQAVQFIQTIRAPMGDAGHVAQCQEALAAFLEDIGVLAWDGEKGRPRFTPDGEWAESNSRLSLHVIPGLTPHALLARYVKSGDPDAFDGKKNGIGMNNTVVGVLEP